MLPLRICQAYQFLSYSVPNDELPMGGVADWFGIAAKRDRCFVIQSAYRLCGYRRDPSRNQSGFHRNEAESRYIESISLLWASVAHEEIVSRANGSTFLEISKANFRPIPVVTPSDCVMQQFEQLVRPLHERIVNNVCQSRTLAALRDALLPKLISGELRVPEGTSKLGGLA